VATQMARRRARGAHPGRKPAGRIFWRVGLGRRQRTPSRHPRLRPISRQGRSGTGYSSSLCQPHWRLPDTGSRRNKVAARPRQRPGNTNRTLRQRNDSTRRRPSGHTESRRSDHSPGVWRLRRPRGSDVGRIRSGRARRGGDRRALRGYWTGCACRPDDQTRNAHAPSTHPTLVRMSVQQSSSLRARAKATNRMASG